MNDLRWLLRTGNPLSLGIQWLTALQQGNDSGSPMDDRIRMVFFLLTIVAGICILPVVITFYLSTTRIFRRIALPTVQATHQGYTAQTYSANLIGRQGNAQTPLRPAGKVLIGDVYYDARTVGTYIASGATVTVTSVEGTSLVVRVVRQV